MHHYIMFRRRRECWEALLVPERTTQQASLHVQTLAARRAPEKPAVASGPDPQFGLSTLALASDRSRLRNVKNVRPRLNCRPTGSPFSNDASAQHHASDPGARAETTEASGWPSSG